MASATRNTRDLQSSVVSVNNQQKQNDMAKFIVKCYYEFCSKAVVEAESFDEAFEKALPLCDAVPVECMTYVGGINAEVMCNDVIEQYTI